MLPDILFVTVIFMLTEVNLVHSKKRKNHQQSQLGKWLTCFSWEESVKRTLYGLANTLEMVTCMQRIYKNGQKP